MIATITVKFIAQVPEGVREPHERAKEILVLACEQICNTDDVLGVLETKAELSVP